MESMYPYVEAMKVGAAYAALLYIWPNVLFRGALRGKGLTFRFLFCALVQPVLISTVVLGLGLVRLLDPWLVRALFWGPFAVSLWNALRRWRRHNFTARLPVHALLTGSYGWKIFFSRIAGAALQRWKEYWRQYREKAAEYLVLSAILLFGLAFFLNGSILHYSFGSNDQYTHFRWTEAMLGGQIFSAGVYPQGMHCFLYALHVLFGVKLHSCVVFLAGIHNSTSFLLAAYCLLKELLRSRHTPLFVLTCWLTFDSFGEKVIESTARMSWTLPQEFGLYLVFLCPLVLLRYFRRREKPERWYRDINLLFLLLGVAGAVSSHFYVLILAFFPCLAVALVHLKELLPVRRMAHPASAVLYGLELGALPMLIACATGTSLEGSLQWGLDVVRRTNGGAAPSSAQGLFAGLLARLAAPFKGFYQGGYVFLFGDLAVWLLLLSLLIPALLVLRWCARRRGKLLELKLFDGAERGYAVLSLCCLFFVLLFAAPSIGLPQLVAIARLPAITQMLAFGLAAVPVDILFLQAGRLRKKELPRSLMAIGCLALYLLAYQTNFHPSTYWYLQRYNAAVTVTDRIMDHYPEGSYHIVSMSNENYHAGSGHHEELLTFLQKTEGREYSLATEYIFLYVEKRPLQLGQMHFLAAPRWLARSSTADFSGNPNRSRCPDIKHAEISEELAAREVSFSPNTWSNYNDLTTRAIICSKAYQWYQSFAAAYPAETSVYYEDDDFVCYVIHQDPGAPLQLTQGER